MTSTIRFLVNYPPGRHKDDIDSQMNYGVQVELVRRGIAEWVNDPVPLAVAAISEPTLKRRQRRSETIEE